MATRRRNAVQGIFLRVAIYQDYFSRLTQQFLSVLFRTDVTKGNDFKETNRKEKKSISRKGN